MRRIELTKKKKKKKSGGKKYHLLLRILPVISRYGSHLMIVIIFVTQNNLKRSRNFRPSPWILPGSAGGGQGGRWRRRGRGQSRKCAVCRKKGGRSVE